MRSLPGLLLLALASSLDGAAVLSAALPAHSLAAPSLTAPLPPAMTPRPPPKRQDDVDPADLASILFTAVPPSLRELAASNLPAAEAEISAEFAASATPAWFAALPSSVQSLLVAEFGAAPLTAAASASATDTAAPESSVPSASLAPSTAASAPSLSQQSSGSASTELPSSTASDATTSSASDATSSAPDATSSAPSASSFSSSLSSKAPLTSAALSGDTSPTLSNLPSSSSFSPPTSQPPLTTRSKLAIGLGVPASVLALAALGWLLVWRRRLRRRRAQRRRAMLSSANSSEAGFVSHFSAPDAYYAYLARQRDRPPEPRRRLFDDVAADHGHSPPAILHSEPRDSDFSHWEPLVADSHDAVAPSEHVPPPPPFSSAAATPVCSAPVSSAPAPRAPLDVPGPSPSAWLHSGRARPMRAAYTHLHAVPEEEADEQQRHSRHEHVAGAMPLKSLLPPSSGSRRAPSTALTPPPAPLPARPPPAATSGPAPSHSLRRAVGVRRALGASGVGAALRSSDRDADTHPALRGGAAAQPPRPGRSRPAHHRSLSAASSSSSAPLYDGSDYGADADADADFDVETLDGASDSLDGAFHARRPSDPLAGAPPQVASSPLAETYLEDYGPEFWYQAYYHDGAAGIGDRYW